MSPLFEPPSSKASVPLSKRPVVQEVERALLLAEADEPGLGQAEVAELTQDIERFRAGAGIRGRLGILANLGRAPYLQAVRGHAVEAGIEAEVAAEAEVATSLVPL